MSALQSKQNEREESASIKETEEDYLLSSEIGHVSPQFFLISWDTPWLRYCLVLITWAITIVLTIHFMSQKRQTFHSVIPEIFDTELSPVKPAIAIEKVRFLGNLVLNESGVLIETFWNPDAPRYTGEPSGELDSRWEKLLKTVGVRLQGAEAETIRGKTIESPQGKSVVGIEVFHQLHCLNLIRQALRPDFYTKDTPEPQYTNHINHCLDHLRQAIMCHADVTPIPFFFDQKFNTTLPDFQIEHTCRNFWNVRDWAIKRMD